MFATNTQYNTEPLLTESDKRPNTSPVSTISLGNLQLSSPPVNSILGRNISSGPGPDLINPRKLTVTTGWWRFSAPDWGCGGESNCDPGCAQR